MRKHDVVYILKSGVPNPELVYSLRSIEANMTHGKVWFYCGKPEGVEPDEYVPMKQTGGSKWERVRSSLVEVCENTSITKQFWLFNDDFYVLKQMTSTKPWFRGLLRDHILRVESRHGHRPTAYTKQLRQCEEQLKQAGMTTLDYALHLPMLIDRAKMLEAIKMFPRCPMFRSIYGNYAQIGGSYHDDVKVMSMDSEINPELDFLSTANKTFGGTAERFLAERFPEPCRYEVER